MWLNAIKAKLRLRHWYSSCGLCFVGSADNPKVHVLWCGVVARVWPPALHLHGSLLTCLRIAWLCWLSQFTSCGLYGPLSISCCSCCESLQILADCTGSFSSCLSKSLRIHADLHRSICRGEATWVPTPPSPSDVSNLVVSMGRQVSIFPLTWFSVTVPVGRCLQGWFPLMGLPWIPLCLWPEVLRPPAST